MLLTGDNQAVAEQIAAEVGIEQVIAEVLPAGQGRRHHAAAEPRARSSRWSATASTTPPPSRRPTWAWRWARAPTSPSRRADITLVRGDLRGAADAIRLSRRTLGTIKANLFWAFAYNVAAIPLAALGLLNPMLAGAAMALSSVFVVSNSLRLRRFRSGVPPAATTASDPTPQYA